MQTKRGIRDLLFDASEGEINFSLRFQPIDDKPPVHMPIVAPNKTKALKAAATIIARLYGCPDATVDLDPATGRMRVITDMICYPGAFSLQAYGPGSGRTD